MLLVTQVSKSADIRITSVGGCLQATGFNWIIEICSLLSPASSLVHFSINSRRDFKWVVQRCLALSLRCIFPESILIEVPPH